MHLRSSLIALLLSLLATVTSAQTVNDTTGSINGRVIDSTRAVLPGATVTATNVETGLTRTVVSDADGNYLIALLPPGRYRVEAQLSGFGKFSEPNVEVLLGNATKVDIALAPQQVSEEVTVTARTPVVDTSRTGVASSVTQDQIANLPLLGRDFRSLALLTPGVVDSFGGRITANGSRGVATDYNVDGATSNNDFFGENAGGTRAPFTFSQAAIREFQVVRSQYDAEYGRGVGAQVNAITRSGTNRMAGEVFLFRRNRDWAAERDRTLPNGQVVSDSFRARDSTQPGFALGGPIVRDKAFFFVNYDGQRQKLPINVNDFRISSGFTGLSATLQQQFLQKLETFIGHPYDQELTYDQTFDQNTLLGKVDVNLNNDLRLSIRNNYTNFENGNNQSFNNLSNQGTENDKFNQLVGTLTWVLNPRLLSQTLVTLSHDERPIEPTSRGAEVQITNITSGTLFFGQNDFLPNNTKERKVQVKETLQYAWGDHTFKAGTELLLTHIDNLFPRNANGVYVYNSANAYVNDAPNTYRQGYGPGGGLTSWDQNTFAFFVTDSFRPTARLSLDLGMRYDWQTMPKPEGNVFPQHPEFVSQIKADRNNVAGRFGFAYDVRGNGRSVLRGGTGQFYGYMPSILLSNPLTQISGNFNQVSITCATATTVPCPTFPNLLTPEQFGQLARVGTDIVTIASDYEAQQAWRSNLQYEQQLGAGYSAGIGVVYSKLDKVQGSRNLNATPTGVMLGNLPVYDLLSPTRRYTDMGVVRELCSCEEASYRALTLETHKLAAGGSNLSWDLSYTLAKSIDQDSNERSTSSSFLFDPFNPALSEGPSDNDVRHRVVGDVTYKFPYGFLVSTIVQWRSGLPYNGGIAFSGSGIPGSPTSLSGLSQTTGNIPVFVNSSGQIINLVEANGFTRQEFSDWLASQGARLMGRNSFRQPDWFTMDLRVAKDFTLPRRTRLQLIVEAFNILNTANEFVTTNNQNKFRATYTQSTGRYAFTEFSTFGLTNSYASSPDPRQVQVAVKFIF